MKSSWTLAHHWNADEIHRQHPHLSLPQIHAALGYYYEHQSECDLAIQQDLNASDELAGRLENTVLQARLRLQAGR